MTMPIDTLAASLKDKLGAIKQYFDQINGTNYPALLKEIAGLEKLYLDAVATVDTQALADLQKEFDDYKALVLSKVGPLGLTDWEKNTYRGFPLDLTGYVETFRSDFNDPAQVTGPTGAGPWYTGVHIGPSGTKWVPLGSTPDPFRVENDTLRIRLEKKADGSWQSGAVQTMRADGVGFSQAMGYFEARVKFPFTADGKGPAGFWGGPWLLSAADFHPEITDHLIEIDIAECYGGGDDGSHATVHVKPRRVPLPGDYPTRVADALYTNIKTSPSSITGQLIWPGKALFDGKFHDHGIKIEDDYLTVYFDGLSCGRYPTLDYFKTPLYFIISSNLNGAVPQAWPSPQDMLIEYCRVMKNYG